MRSFSTAGLRCFSVLFLILLFPSPLLYAEWPVLEELDQSAARIEQAAALAVTATAPVEGAQRMTMRLNGDWHQCIQGESEWTVAQVPDTWRGSGPSHVRWFARRFVMPPAYAGKHIRIAFNAVMLYAEVWLNGRHLGSHAGGYTPFSVDATAAVRPGEPNTLLVYVKDNTYAIDGENLYHQVGVTPFLSQLREPGDKPGSGGIWQDVMLEGLDPIHVEDVYIRTSVREHRLDCTVTIRNTGPVKHRVIVFPEIREWPDGRTVVLRPNEQSLDVAPGETGTLEFSESWAGPKFWSPEHPHLYTLTTNLYAADPLADVPDGPLRDVKTTRFGFREFRIDGSRFLLNEQPIRLRGKSNCAFLHRYDYTKRVMEVAKAEFGLNSFRSHANIGPELIFQAADEVGLLMIDQSSIWSNGKRGYTAGGQRFLDNTRREFAEWVKRDRNHPSVVIWDVENEMIRGALGTGMKDVFDWVMQLDGFITPHDSTRPVEHSGAGSAHPDLSIYHIHHHPNYSELYDAYLRRPDKPMIAGEWWVGGQSGERRLTTGEEFQDYRDYLRRVAPLWKERMDEQRIIGLAGIQPFSWMRGGMLQTFEDLEQPPITWPDPTAPDIKPANAPAYLHMKSWNLPGPEYTLVPETTPSFTLGLSPFHAAFTCNQGYYFADERLKNSVTASNDNESTQAVSVTWQLLDDGRVLAEGSAAQMLEPAGQFTVPVEAPLPDVQGAPKFLDLKARLLADGQVVSEDHMTITVFSASVHTLPKLGEAVALYDPNGSMAGKLAGANLRKLTAPPDLAALRSALILGEGLGDAFWQQHGAKLWQWAAQGNRLLVLRQDAVPAGLPVAMGMYQLPPVYTYNALRNFDFGPEEKILFYSRCAMFHTPAHPVLQGLPGDRTEWWRFKDGRVADDIYERPTVKNAPIATNIRSILGGTRVEYSSLLEFRHGRGLVVLTQLHFGNNYALDPSATRLFHNLLGYLASPAAGMPTATAAIIGDLPGGFSVAADGTPETADVVIVGKARITNALEAVLRSAVERGSVVLMTPDAPLPQMLADKVRLEPLTAEPAFAPVKQYSQAIAGFNSFDTAVWPEPCVRRNIVVTEGTAVDGHVLVGAAPISTSGGMQGIRHSQYRPLGNALVEIPMARGRIIVSQIPWPAGDNNRAKYVYGAILTNLGVRVGE